MKLYHYTHRKNRESILEKGLLLRSKQGSIISYENRIFFSTNYDDILCSDFINCWDNFDIWEAEVPVEKIFPDEFSHINEDGKRPQHVYVTEPIPNPLLFKHVPLHWTEIMGFYTRNYPAWVGKGLYTVIRALLNLTCFLQRKNN